MTPARQSPNHELNNLLCKIIGSAELALLRVTDSEARMELEAIIDLAETAASVVARRAPLSPWNG